MQFTSGQAEVVGGLLQEHRLLARVSIDIDGALAAKLIGMIRISAAVLLAMGPKWSRGFRVGALLAAVLSALPLTLLLTNPVWIQAMGGFPAIGAGQGIIKYVAVAGVALFVYAHHTANDRLRHHACNAMLAGLLLPLVWIGGMKFTAIEAAGIEPLLASSPFFSWMLLVFTSQGASNIIGLTELVTAALLTCWWLRPPLFVWGAVLTVVTFFSTLSFLVTLPGWHESIGFPALSGAGVFIIKDLGLLAAAVIVLGEYGGKRLEC